MTQESNSMAKKGIYVGTGIGLILFVLVGMFPGSLIGGAVGLFISNALFGAEAGTQLLPRIITAVSMVGGILGSAGVFVIGTSVLGWAAGTAMDAVHSAKEATTMEPAEQKAAK